MAELIIFGVLAAIVGLAVWLYLAGTRPQDVDDEEPTLNTRNDLDEP